MNWMSGIDFGLFNGMIAKVGEVTNGMAQMST